MLQIRDISKEYRTGTLVQKALDHVSLNLRDNEFVAILGPSGSGKTTLLNIIGGLDRYDSGDLIINGVSTKKYKDRDWDSYRNHTIGFVFQSYNLIPHQTVLSNVELALTIGGISRKNRRERAMEALKKVGLGDQMHKKPSQMSGGQMQRVAIARALVNDPDILLADEPTGALDSETSIQVMDLLKEVAKDRLVVMVTHNPELAEQYATRIVRLRDGVIRSDTDPFEVPEEAGEHRNLGKASMSFLTALSLSFNNLRTKLTRTVLVAFAGSIGIIGIALILSLSTGVNKYIHDIEEETLSEYPLMIQGASFDAASFFEPQIAKEDWEDDVVYERRVATSMFSSTTSNDLKSLKKYFDSDESHIRDYSRAIEYSYSVSPQIYSYRDGQVRQVNPDQTFSAMGFSASSVNGLMSAMTNTDLFYRMPEEKSLYLNQYDVKAGRWPENYNELVLVLSRSGRVNDLTLYALGMKDSAELDDMIETFSKGDNVEESTAPIGKYDYEDFLDIDFRLVNSADYYVYDSKYDVYTDKTKDDEYLKKIVSEGEVLKVVGVVKVKEDASIAMLESGLYYMPSLITHLMEESDDAEIIQKQMADKEINVISGKPFGEDKSESNFDMGSLFSVDESAMEDAFKFDTSKLNVDFSSMDMSNIDLAGMFDPSAFTMPGADLDFSSLLSKIKITATREDLEKLFTEMVNGYLDYAGEDPSTNYRRLPESLQGYLATENARNLLENDVREIVRASGISSITAEDIRGIVSNIMSGLPAYIEANQLEDMSRLGEYIQGYLQTEEVQKQINDGAAALIEKLASSSISREQLQKMADDLLADYTVYAEQNEMPDLTKFNESFTSYMESEPARKMLMEGVSKAVDTTDLENEVKNMMGDYSQKAGSQITKMITEAMQKVAGLLGKNIQSTMEKAFANIGDAFSFNLDAFRNAIKVEMGEKELNELLTSMMSADRSSYEGNLKKFGYADDESPSSITIYPLDFESKNKIIDIINDYNTRMDEAGEKDKVISFTDIVGTLMSSVTDIINAISYVLIAFVAISLVVSSIMIGVITYISVLERKKEIGILRAIGASKRNISEVFNAETFIIGILAGLFGVGISLLLLIPGNKIIHSFTDADINAFLPPEAGVILVALSVILTLIGGIIPSRKAARSDPVEALRTE